MASTLYIVLLRRNDTASWNWPILSIILLTQLPPFPPRLRQVAQLLQRMIGEVEGKSASRTWLIVLLKTRGEDGETGLNARRHAGDRAAKGGWNIELISFFWGGGGAAR